MIRPLSISAYNVYVECPQKYKIQYIDKIRQSQQISPLIFGLAVDKGINAILSGEGDPYKEAETSLKRVFIEPTEFLTSDYDGELLTEEEKSEVLRECRRHGYKGDDVDHLATSLLEIPFAQLSKNQIKALTSCCFASLRTKARLMLDAYRKFRDNSLNDISSI